MSETETIVVGRELPRLAAVWAAGPTRVKVAWRGGSEHEIDLAPVLQEYQVYGPLRADPHLFQTVHLGEGGGSIAWGADDAIDMSAVTLERLAEAAERSRKVESAA